MSTLFPSPWTLKNCKYLALLILTCGFLACNSGKKTTDVVKEENPCKPLTVGMDAFQESSDPFQLKGAQIKGNCLEINVQYGGGCGEESFQLLWNGKVKKSDPPVANLQLLFKDEDNCKKLVMKTLQFDLSGLQNLAGAQKEMKVILKDFDSLLYYKF